ncbi:MarR family transcriptional regulator [Amycolatopsis sp. NPDC005232]|uniref:MarR family winged helix-turn-helix transcriptional regulator n=1 Tax=Amycolatopsis sp. NPDC005232 TaxID=3157027 RepID=UPI0033B88A4D
MRDGPAGYTPPPSVGRSDLLNAGGDNDFRQMISDISALAANLTTIRTHLAALLDLTPPQYHVLMTVAQHQGADGISIGALARYLHLSGAFVTTEAGALVRRGLLVKQANPNDRRSVLLRLTRKGEQDVERISPHLVEINDRVFEPLGRRGFRDLCQNVQQLVATSEAACSRLSDTPVADLGSPGT